MKITVDRAALLAALTWTGKAVAARVPVPILAGVRLEVAGDQLTAATFDYEQARRVHVPGSDSEPGVILVGAKELIAVVKSMPHGKNAVVVELETVPGETVPAADGGESTPAEDTLQVRCQGVTAAVTGMPLANYPHLPERPKPAGVISGETFARAVTRVARAAGTDDTLPALTCVAFETGPAAVIVAATDRYRLAVDEMPWAAADPGAPERLFLVPAPLAIAFAQGCGDKVALGLSVPEAPEGEQGHGRVSGFAALCDGTRELITRIVDSEFPRWRSLMASKRTRTVLADASQLAEAITRAGKICKRLEAVRLEFGRAGLAISVVRDGTVVSSQRAPVTAKGKPFTIASNPEYLASMLAGVTGQVRLGFRQPDQPVHISPAEDGDMFRALVVPIRIAG
jgi:DNA polymerase III subunit beta